jgi:predicted metal-binding membrane protein
MEMQGPLLETVLRRDRVVLVAGLIAVIGLAWGWLLSGAGMGMSAVEMTAMAGMDGWLMQPALWTPAYAVLIFAMWWVMMVAMMLPGAAPTLLLFARVNRKDKSAGTPLPPTAMFALGYLLVWGGFGAVATALQWGLETARLLSPMLQTTNRWLGAGILIAAGLWQLTPLKAVCLRHCRTPLGFLIGNWRAGRLGALRMGLEHGAYCLGCCWFLMALLFFGGIMNLYWIAGLAVYVLLEKTSAHGHWLGRIAGVALVAWGLVLAIQAQ